MGKLFKQSLSDSEISQEMLAPTIIPTSPPLQCKNVAHFRSQEFLGKVKGLHCFLIDYYLEKPAKKCLNEQAIRNTLFSLFLRPSSELSFLRAGGRWVQGLILPIFFILLCLQCVYPGRISCSFPWRGAGDFICLCDLKCHSFYITSLFGFFIKNDQRN